MVSATDMGVDPVVTLVVSVTETLSLVTEVSAGVVVSEMSEVMTAVEKLTSELSGVSVGGGAVSEGIGCVCSPDPDIPRAL